MASFHSGFISLIGPPNAGKSTLMNALLGQKLSIVTHKPQTTRHRIVGIVHRPAAQLVFLDTPGVIQPRYGLQQAMMATVDLALADADVILLVLAADVVELPEALLHRLAQTSKPLLLALNKADLSTQEGLLERLQAVRAHLPGLKEAVSLSALHNFNLPILLTALEGMLPEGPPYYEADQITDRPERFFVAELIREKIFFHFHQEIPYSVEVTITLFEEREDLTYIDAEVHVERQSQKGMLIGKGGAAMKRIGTLARQDIEQFLGRKVFLNLYARVAESWKDDPNYLKNFGYKS